MDPRDIEVPAIVRKKAEVDGDGGAGWVATLPGLVGELERAWRFDVTEPIGGGTSSFTARVRTREGMPAVLKVAVPDAFFGRQIRTLLAADGRGYVEVLAHDVDRHAVLLEELGPSADRAGIEPAEQLIALADTLRLAWMLPRPQDADGEPVDKAHSLLELIERLRGELGQVCSDRVVEEALSCAERRSAAFDPELCVVVHGDAAPPNLLRVRRKRRGVETGFVFVDPDGFVGDPAYDLGVAVRDWSPQLLAGDPVSVARGYCRLLATRSGVDEDAIWDWGLLERVSTGLYVLSLDAPDLASPFLTTAEALVGRDWTASPRPAPPGR